MWNAVNPSAYSGKSQANWRMPVRFGTQNRGPIPALNYYSSMIQDWEGKIESTNDKLRGLLQQPGIKQGDYYQRVQMPQTNLLRQRDAQRNALKSMVMFNQFQIVQAAKLLNSSDMNAKLAAFDEAYHMLIDSNDVDKQKTMWNQMAELLIDVVKKGNL